MPAANDARRNRLADETSPYLQQHAANPVDWYPWGAEALERARREDRPILLSIGYSACHWCHVMAHESFEDEATARLMNERYVNVKVDREERPDLDRVYQLAHQVLVQRGGGWPLTMFLAPEDQLPFFGGTYFPKEPRHGAPAFREVLARVAEWFDANRGAVAEQNARLRGLFDSLVPAPPTGEVVLDRAPLDAARAGLERAFDRDWGGFGAAPKFPQPGWVARLLRHWHASAGAAEPDLHALWMASLTLTRMAEGGLQDQVGGGFARYSTDAFWMIPHFEKMLSDNAQLLGLYADAALATGEDLFRRTAAATADWVLREMQAPEGGWYAALDADSDGGEGRFYVWDRAEAQALLDAGQWAVLAPRYGLDRAPNFEGHAWHLHAHVPLDEVAATAGVDVPTAQARLEAALARLRAARERRPRPGRDEKVLTAWNGLMVGAMARAARTLDRADLETAATRTVERLRAVAWRDGVLYASSRDGVARVPGFLDDYAFLADGLLELLQLRWRNADLEFAVALVEALLARFEDREHGGFWFTPADGEPLAHRPKPFADEALPAGNGVAARVLGRLGHLLGEPRYLDAAERTLRAAAASLARWPEAHAALLDALEEWLYPVETVVLRGPEAERWRRELAPLWSPRRLVFAIPDDARLPPTLALRRASGGTLAYVCSGSACGPPIDSLSRLVRRLRDGLELVAPD